METTTDTTLRNFWDTLGMSLAGISLLQSLAVPVALSIWSLGATAETLYAGPYPAPVLALGPIAIIAMWRGYGQHRQLHIVGLMALGLVMLAAMPLEGEVLGARGELFGALLGSSLLLEGHWRNRRALCRYASRVSACSTSPNQVHRWASGYEKGTAGDACW